MFTKHAVLGKYLFYKQNSEEHSITCSDLYLIMKTFARYTFKNQLFEVQMFNEGLEKYDKCFT